MFDVQVVAHLCGFESMRIYIYRDIYIYIYIYGEAVANACLECMYGYGAYVYMGGPAANACLQCMYSENLLGVPAR